MKTKLLLLFANVLLTVQLTRAQTTVQIGTVVSGGGCYFPVYNSTFETCSTCWITHVRANVLWTKAELSAAGIDSGATIISVEFAKRLIGGAFTVPVVFKMYMGNSNTTAFGNPITNPVSWASILASDSLVYSNSSFNLTTDVQAGAYRWIKWDVIPFVYKGSTLEIATELVMGSNVGSGTQIFWQRPSIPNPLGDKVIAGTGVGVAPDFLNSTLTTPMGRPNIRITYLAPASCPTPASITINNIAASSATISWPAVTGANDGYEYALTAGTTPPASGTAFSTTSVQATGLNSNTLYYARVPFPLNSNNQS